MVLLFEINKRLKQHYHVISHVLSHGLKTHSIYKRFS